jgi:hypothetical protein
MPTSLPTPADDLTTLDLKKVFLGVTINAAALRETQVDAATEYQADLAGAVSRFVEEQLLERGVPAETFTDKSIEEFLRDNT